MQLLHYVKKREILPQGVERVIETFHHHIDDMTEVYGTILSNVGCQLDKLDEMVEKLSGKSVVSVLFPFLNKHNKF